MGQRESLLLYEQKRGGRSHRVGRKRHAVERGELVVFEIEELVVGRSAALKTHAQRDECTASAIERRKQTRQEKSLTFPSN